MREEVLFGKPRKRQVPPIGGPAFEAEVQDALEDASSVLGVALV